MKDQPFKRCFPSEKAANRTKDNTEPSYQRYFHNRVAQPLQSLTPKAESNKAELKGATSIEVVKQNLNFHSPQKSQKTNLRTELENLKKQVHRLMEKKHGVLHPQISHPVIQSFGSKNNLNDANNLEIETEQSDSDTQSVTSEKLINETIRKIDNKQKSENLNRQNYLKMINEQLQNQIRVLKNKYVNKKKQLGDKCTFLEKRVEFLQHSLENNEQNLTKQILALKELVNRADRGETHEEVPTSDKTKQLAQLKQSGVTSQKIRALYDQISSKSNIISENTQKMEKMRLQLSRLRRENDTTDRTNKQLRLLLQELKQDLMGKQNINQQLKQQLVELNASINQQKDSKETKIDQFKQQTQYLKSQYEQKFAYLQKDLEQLQSQNKELTQAKILLSEENAFLSKQHLQIKQKSEELNERYKRLAEELEQSQKNHQAFIERKDSQYQQILRQIKNQFQNKILTSPKIVKVESQKQKLTPNNSKQYARLEKELRKWKTQYKLLKERFDELMSADSKSKDEAISYYKCFKSSTQQLEICTKNIKSLQNSLANNQQKLTAKQKELKQINLELSQLRIESAKKEKQQSSKIKQLQQQMELIEQKYNQEQLKSEKQISYRQGIQEKLSTINDAATKDIIEKMKKRMVEQDEKHSKNIKQLKIKQTLIQNLKKELKDVMENVEKKMQSEKQQQIKSAISTYNSKELDSFKIWKEKLSNQVATLREVNSKLLLENQEVKIEHEQTKAASSKLQKQIKGINHLYLEKCEDIEALKEQLRRTNEEYMNIIKDVTFQKQNTQSILKQELLQKTQQVALLRAELLSSKVYPEKHPKNNNFDEALRNHIESSNKLRQESNKKTEEIFRLRDNYNTLRSQYQNLKSEIEINKLKTISQKKNLEVNSQIQLQNTRSLVQAQEKKVSSLQQKIKVLIEQNKKKDQFIQNYIIGKKLPQGEKELVAEFIKKYEISMGSNDIVNKLNAEGTTLAKLEAHNRELLRQLSQVKAKLLLYEAMDIDQSLSKSMSFRDQSTELESVSECILAEVKQ